MEGLLTKDDLYNIPQELMPMPVLSDNARSMISGAINAHTKGVYNHFMWLIEPGYFATQNVTGFKKVPIKDYLKKNRLKLFVSKCWTEKDRENILTQIRTDLALPWYKRRYDFLAYIGQLTGLRWIQSPWANICSERMSYIPDFCMTNPNPQELNKWLEQHEGFEIYGWYLPN